jgi:hypothetical protein
VSIAHVRPSGVWTSTLATVKPRRPRALAIPMAFFVLVFIALVSFAGLVVRTAL